jgi:excisionase family DNA binding protein
VTTPVPEWRPAVVYLHGDPTHPTVVLPPRASAWLAQAADLDRRLADGRDIERDVYEVLLAIRHASHQHHQSTSAACGSAVAATPELPASSKLMTSSQAADQLGIGDRAVRLAIAKGHLPAQLHGRCWRITPAGIGTYRTYLQGM